MTQTSRRLSITSDGPIPGLRRGQALITLVTGPSAPRICGGQSRQGSTLDGRLVRQIGVHPFCQRDNIAASKQSSLGEDHCNADERSCGSSLQALNNTN